MWKQAPLLDYFSIVKIYNFFYEEKNMLSKQTEKMKTLIKKVLEEHKAEQCKILDVRNLTDLTDCMIICNGSSSRHLKILADKITENVKKHFGFKPLSTSRGGDNDWVVVDLWNIIVHLMLPRAREEYVLEELWDASFAKSATKRLPLQLEGVKKMKKACKTKKAATCKCKAVKKVAKKKVAKKPAKKKAKK